MTRKIVVYSGNPDVVVARAIAMLDRTLPDTDWLVVHCTPRKTLRGLARNQWRHLRSNGLLWLAHLAHEVMVGVASRLRHRRAGHADSPLHAAAASLRMITTTDLQDKDTLAAITNFAPDLGLALAAPILRPPVFSIPRLGTLNLHKGKLPEYRGMPPAFWELWNDEASVGCSVHWVDEKLDTGQLVAEATLPRARYSTLRGLQLQLDEVGIGLLHRAVTDVFQGRAAATPQRTGGRTYRKPTLAQVRALGRKMVVDPATSTDSVKRFAKSLATRSINAAWRIGFGRILEPRVTVLLYHRVSDDVRDNLTVGIEQFDRQMQLLSDHCDVLSLQEMLANPVARKSARPVVCITFDDGYLDNAVHAAPLMKRRGIPGAFFVSTGIVGSTNPFPHDVERRNPQIPVMQWDHLREMHADGFFIGSHSVMHIDCARESEERVVAELAQSREDLRRELGISEFVFAYPFGGKQHMTPARLELVKAAGYCACLSAYGGTNAGAIDVFDIRRRGIHWEFSEAAFLHQCLGL